MVVTGASTGIGHAIATRLAKDGHHLVLCAPDPHEIEYVTRALGCGIPVGADVTDPHAMRRLARTALEHYGRLDVWINNAGLVPHGRLGDQRDDELARTIDVNVTGVVNGSRAALTHMQSAGYGHIISIASLCAVKPLAGLAVYSATKAAVLAYGEALRRELRTTAPGLHVSTVLPYLVNTAAARGLKHRLVQPLEPSQIAGAVARLIARPRSTLYLPTWPGRLLPYAALLPERVRDLADDLMDIDDIPPPAPIPPTAPATIPTCESRQP
ncbi:SDR family NAD(P)-dependent oxidoreductase [Streptomyces sp. ISL-44]|uniref:SDR family NAD(P)-dependent oxidoreductase n=1 Tax=Streptomyces sp. ISL-44 TaxID=2819184 RepID=UPI001BE59CC9|nr:SDR family NAD(P)-dependent oxidoreductase [Streptomyces sp. ISL-44]MBT2543063.1 SDR family NAD(P)-dependent oxidoreductase [Streptomyces sp. ISL-44]